MGQPLIRRDVSPPSELAFRPSPPPEIAYEMKGCEFCSGNFMRPKGSSEKYCRPCKMKIAERERKQRSAPPWPRLS